jgi:diguanylate cyclase (GGDEF)-like protein
MRSFRNRLLVLIIGLVIAAQTVTLLAVLGRTQSAVRSRANEQLNAGAAVAKQLLDYRATQLANAVGVLAADFGLREAVASGDRATILSAARNHSRRIGADLLLVLDVDGKVMAASRPIGVLSTDTVSQLTPETTSSAFLQIENASYQVLAVPIRAPDPIAFVAIGFVIDQKLALELKQLLDVDVAFVVSASGQATVASTSLPTAGQQSATDTLIRAIALREPHEAQVAGADFLTVSERLNSGDHALAILLLKSMDAVNAPYIELRNTLTLIAFLSVVLATVVGIRLGRAATRPVEQLVAGVQRIERGDYGSPIEVPGTEEFAQLASSVNAMQRGIADRELRITHQSRHDPVTGLPNRQHFETLLAERMQGATGELISVAIIEVADLRHFSANLGLQFADQVLLELGQRLTREVELVNLVARLQGARFAFATVKLRRSAVESLIKNLCQELRTRLRVDGVNVRIVTVAGLAFAPEHGDTPAELLRRAEIALDAARSANVQVRVFEADQEVQQLRRLRLSADLPDSVGTGQMHLVFQPKVSVKSRRVRGAETLVRWHHSTLGDVSPGEFVPLAESTGATGILTRWILRAALRQLGAWRRDGFKFELAVNLSAGDIIDPELPDYVLEQLQANGLPTTALILEITESAVMRDVKVAARNMEQLRVAGVRFAIDDFGTGYSSLSQLKGLPVDELKIDRSFVRDAADDEDDALIVRSTIELGHSMGLRVVAEGVETEAAMQLLAQMGCDEAQGYHIAKPMDATRFTEYLRANQQDSADADTAVHRALKLRNRVRRMKP